MEVKFEIDECIWERYCEICETAGIDPRKFLAINIQNGVVNILTTNQEELQRTLREASPELRNRVDSIMRRSKRSVDGSDTGQ